MRQSRPHPVPPVAVSPAPEPDDLRPPDMFAIPTVHAAERRPVPDGVAW